MKTKPIAIAISSCLIGILTVTIGKRNEEVVDAHPPEEAVVKAEVKHTVFTDAKTLSAIEKKIIDEINQDLPLEAKDDLPKEEALLISFKRMQKVAGKFNSESFVRSEIEALLEDPETLSMATDILVSLEKAQTLFGEEQALARVYALKILEANAEMGDTYPLYETTAELAEHLDRQAKNNEQFSKRQDLDLIELVNASLNTFDHNAINEIPESILYEVGYQDAQDDKIRSIYANAFGPIFAEQAGIDQALVRVQKLFKKDS